MHTNVNKDIFNQIWRIWLFSFELKKLIIYLFILEISIVYLKLLTYGCVCIVLKVNRFFGSFLSIPTSKDLKGSVTKLGICILHFPIASNNLYTLSPSNGYSPVTKLYLKKLWFCYYMKIFITHWYSYNVTPLLQISILKPEYSSAPFAISGGWNAGEPWLDAQIPSGSKGDSA